MSDFGGPDGAFLVVALEFEGCDGSSLELAGAGEGLAEGESGGDGSAGEVFDVGRDEVEVVDFDLFESLGLSEVDVPVGEFVGVAVEVDAGDGGFGGGGAVVGVEAGVDLVDGVAGVRFGDWGGW